MFILLVSCEGNNMKELAEIPLNISDISSQKWNELANKKIYFGHQSVGFNIVSGITKIMQQVLAIKLNIEETKNPRDFNETIFAHSRVGMNKKPLSKIDDFKRIIESGIGDKVDIACFKFCYIDITAETNVEQVFTAYKSTMDSLAQKYENATFVHITVPLRTVQTGLKAWIKKILGKPIGGYADNISRNQFNKLLKNEYTGKSLIFDLAAIESTYPDGGRETFEKDGKQYYALVPNYSKDGGHLNETGRWRVAEQLLIFLANQ